MCVLDMFGAGLGDDTYMDAHYEREREQHGVHGRQEEEEEEFMSSTNSIALEARPAVHAAEAVITADGADLSGETA